MGRVRWFVPLPGPFYWQPDKRRARLSRAPLKTPLDGAALIGLVLYCILRKRRGRR